MEEVWSILKRQKYKIVGEHSAVKICHWTKKSLIEGRVCYKQRFYGIESHRCLQMTPSVAWCTHKCLFCWRPVEYTETNPKRHDDPETIIDGCIEAQRTLLSGYHGFLEKIDIKKLKEAENPTNVAISLSGEPTLYPEISGLIDGFRKRNFSTFLVTNGTTPEILESMSTYPDNLYITLPAPTKESYERVCNPQIKDGWEKLNTSLELFPKIKTKRRILRLTLVKDFNMNNLREYSKLIEKASPDFIEAKAYMYVGYSRKRLELKNMPRFEDIIEFCNALEIESGYKPVDSSSDSRVVLLSKK
jgi:tRNA wybutosine-synthesizing protein 1